MDSSLADKGIIFSPDFIGLNKCLEILLDCRGLFSAIKIGNIYLYKYGIKVVRQIKSKIDLPVICDFKLMDIPEVAEEILRIGMGEGIDGAMIWGLAGEETLARCLHSFHKIKIFLLTEYTHGTDSIGSELGNKSAQMAIDLGAYGIQAPATRPERIIELRKIIGNELKIISCGVGHQGSPYGTAVRNCADYEIIGRSIYNSQNPLAEAEKAFAAINSAKIEAVKKMRTEVDG